MPIARRSFLLGLACAGLLNAVAMAGPAGTRVGTVEAVFGECVGRQAGGETRVLTAGSAIFKDDVLITGDHARLDFKLGAATRIVLRDRAQFAVSRFIVDRGSETGAPRLVPFERLGNPAAVTAPFGIIAARG